MENTKREKLITLLDYWIASEFLDTESMDEKKLLNIKKSEEEAYEENILVTGNETINDKLIARFDAHKIKPEEYREKHASDKECKGYRYTVVFGHVNRKIFTEYFYKKQGDNDLNKCDFDDKEYIPYASYSYRYDDKKDKYYYGADISALFLALEKEAGNDDIACFNPDSYEKMLNNFWSVNQKAFSDFDKIPDNFFRLFALKMDEFSKDVREAFTTEELSEGDFRAFRRELFKTYIIIKSTDRKNDAAAGRVEKEKENAGTSGRFEAEKKNSGTSEQFENGNMSDTGKSQSASSGVSEIAGLGMDGKFFIRDLQMLRNWIATDEKFSENPYEEALSELILSQVEPIGKTHINISPSAEKPEELVNLFNSCLSPSKAPIGKWAGGRRPYLYQQLAVNLFKDDATQIFTVNGSPGTGKTTLLRELIADVITKKALRISEILTECDFNKERIFDIRERLYTAQNGEIATENVYFLKEEYTDLYDYGILIASGNNEAVENITRELPAKLAEPYKKIKKALLEEMYKDSRGLPKEEILNKYFTLPITATLGRKGNLEQYRKREVIKKYSSLKEDEEAGLECIKALTALFLKKYEEVVNKQKALSIKAESRENCWDEYFQSGRAYEKGGAGTKEALRYTEIQRSNPVTDDEFDKLREELFICAWMLHQMFAWQYSGISKAFKYALETIYEGKIFDTDRGKEKQFYYNSLFFVSPVISSTFASIRRTFRGLNIAESLGMLFVDEAGQVKTKDALGALLRVKKAMIVGDPRQIPPVIPPSEEFALNYLCPDIYKEQYKKRLRETGYDASLQEYADAVNPYGTKILDSWVGCPLVLHSRCNSPMFEISNALSYNNTMINLSESPEAAGKSRDEFILDDSYWIQVKGREGGGEKNRFVKRQAEAVLKMILEKCEKMLKKPGFDSEKDELLLFVITPFTSVAVGLKNYINTYLSARNKGNTAKDEIRLLLSKWAGRKIGTVHTFQGKETDEVILLLGCDSFSKRSAEWVFTNIVNVAASRAKYRFYIVGDTELFRHKRGESKESPVNIARRILNKTCGNDNRLGLSDLNERLKNTPYRKLSTGKEKEEFICPVCKSAVIKGVNGWFCVGKNYGRCDMSFNIYDNKLDSISIKRLLSGSDTWFDTHNEQKQIYHIYPEIVTDRVGKSSFRRFKFDENGDVKEGNLNFMKLNEEELGSCWSDNKESLPVFLLCNCSKLMQQHRKSHDKNNTNIEDYFDIMVLDAVYTLCKFKSENTKKDSITFNSTDIMKILSGNPHPDLKSDFREIIEKRMNKLIERSYYKTREQKEDDKPILSNITVSDKNKHLYRVNLKEEGSFFFKFLDNYGERAADRTVLRIPIEYLNPVYENALFEGEKYESKTGKAMFPMSLKWVMIKYYLLYRIAYMYRVRTTSSIISFKSMDEALDLSVGDKEYTRMEKKRFYEKIDDYLRYLKGKKYILDYRIIKSTKDSGYLGISGIEILNTLRINRETGEVIKYPE